MVLVRLQAAKALYLRWKLSQKHHCFENPSLLEKPLETELAVLADEVVRTLSRSTELGDLEILSSQILENPCIGPWSSRWAVYTQESIFPEVH
jgi:hypothetical protein